MTQTADQSRRPDLVLWLLTLAFGALYGWLSLAVYRGYNAGMLDLGNMAQAFWTTLHGDGKPLELTQALGNRSRLAGHAEVIYLLLAPAYALWEDPRALLVIQAGLMAAGALPVYRMALRHLRTRGPARAFALVYLLYPTGVAAVLFDFHGDTLAMPLLLFALDALDQAAWRRYALFIALSLLCKFYIAAPVALLGLSLLKPDGLPYLAAARSGTWSLGRWNVTRIGLLTMGAALVYGAVTFFIVRRIFASPIPGTVGQGTEGYIAHYFSGFAELGTQDILARLVSLAAVLLPVALLSFRAPRALLPAAAIIVPALVSTGPADAFDFRYHHYAAAVPFIVSSAVLGAARRTQGRRRQPATLSATMALLLTTVLHIALNDTPLGVTFWLGQTGSGLDPSRYGSLPRDRVVDHWLAAHVPPRVPIAASNFLAPHLTNRSTLYLLRYPTEGEPESFRANIERVELVVADALSDYYVSLPGQPGQVAYAGGIAGDHQAIAVALRDQRFGLVAEHDGLLLFRRGATPTETLEQRAEPLDGDPAALPGFQPLQARFGDAIELLGYSAEQLGTRRLQLRLYWRPLRELSTNYVAVSRLGAPDGRTLRFPHLATAALLPTGSWAPGTTIAETRTLMLPDDAPAGSYQLRVGWYHPAHPLAGQSDPAALLKGSAEVAVGPIEIRE